MQILVYIICGLVVAFAITAFVVACEQSAEVRRKEKEIKAEEERINEITTEANNTKANARTGDHERDFNYMADKLHEFAKK